MMTPKRVHSNKHRRLAVSLLGILILCFCFPNPLATTDIAKSESTSIFQDPYESKLVASAESSGNNLDSIATYSREIQGLDISLMNSFADTSTHNQTIDFSGYHIAGWTLYEVVVNTSRIVAIPEVEVIGSNNSPSYHDFAINETSVGDQYYSELAQGFYNMSHDGKLHNISLLYDSSAYIPASQNYAYFDLRSDHRDGSTNMVSSVQLEHVGLTPTWANITESAILDAGSVYYAVMNGSKIVEFFNIYPVIRWYYQDSAGSFLTQRYSTEYGLWSSDRPFEAFLNYTYTPWNTTTDTALEFQDPNVIDLMSNSSSLTGSEWLFSSTSNVSEVKFSSNQSISIEYNLTLRYKKDITSTSSWYAGTSGSNIMWNVTSILDFPELSGSQDKNLTLALPGDWTANHLFNESNPTEYYDHFTQIEANVVCSSLADETWILECTSPNYLQTLSKYDTSDDSTITDKVSVSVDMDINATIESPTSVPATNGDACLRVFYQSTEEYAENVSVTVGESHHQWDISTDSSSNGLHTIDLYWMNGTEVGYLTTDVLVYYQTTLDADEYFINAFTEDTFYIGIDFNQIFPVAGIDASSANVTYSFGSVVNDTLDDRSNGRWDATVSTDSMSPGTHNLYVYAEGYALENRSITIDVSLIHETEALAISWSNGFDISYVQTTELSIGYNRVGGSPIPSASVNVTIGTQTWELDYDSGTYKITFNGTDAYPGFDTFGIQIDAARTGYESQSNDTQSITYSRESTAMTIDWSNGKNITYLEYTTLTVSYTMSNTSTVRGSWVNITISGSTLTLHENTTDGTYYLRFNGSDSNLGFEDHDFTISAWKYGFDEKTSVLDTLTLREVPTLFDASWVGSNVITYVESTILSINYTMIDGIPVTGATVWVMIDDDPWLLTWDGGTETYRKEFTGDEDPPGFGVHSLTVNASKLGHQNYTSPPMSLTIEIEPTSLVVELIPFNINYTDYTTVFVDYLMSNSYPISDGSVTITVGGGASRPVIWNGARYELVIYGNDSDLSFGPTFVTIQASNFGYASASSAAIPNLNITLNYEPTNLWISWSNGFDLGFFDYTFLIVEYTYKTGLPVLDAAVNVTIGTARWNLGWNETEGYYQLRFNGSDPTPGVGTHLL
ncbi:MAG: hypothetical protein RTV31_16110, partial [Candidatus Thorarchaeota archaeon]